MLAHSFLSFISFLFPLLHTHLSRLSLWASILQSFPLVWGASRLPHSFCRMERGMRKAFGPTSVVMLLAGSSRDVSMLWESCRESGGKFQALTGSSNKLQLETSASGSCSIYRKKSRARRQRQQGRAGLQLCTSAAVIHSHY